ncbi:hypothetical protein [Pseudomonas sp. R16(2017)]
MHRLGGQRAGHSAPDPLSPHEKPEHRLPGTLTPPSVRRRPEPAAPANSRSPWNRCRESTTHCSNTIRCSNNNRLSGVDTMAGTASLGASMAAMQQMDATAAATTTMNAQAQSNKMMTDTVNGIASAYQDSATKAQNAAQQTGKAINY